MLDSHARRPITGLLHRQHWDRRLNPVGNDQRKVLIKRAEIIGDSITRDKRGPHANDNRTSCSGGKPDALDIICEVLLTARRRVLPREMIAIVDHTPNDHFKIELIHIRRICHRIAWRVGPNQHNSNLLRRVGNHPGRFEGRAATFGKGSRWRFVIDYAVGGFKHPAHVQQAPSLMRARKAVACEPSAEITGRV